MLVNYSGYWIITHHSQNLDQIIFLLFCLISPSVTPLSFDFPIFSPTDINTISLEGDANLDRQFLRLTKSCSLDQQEQSVGRATYHKPFLLRETTTGKLADFSTHFTFIIHSQKSSEYGNGLTFFLAPDGSLLNRKLGKGSNLGLPVEHLPARMSTNQYPFVAVEFDISQNGIPTIQDPIYDHVGVDVNSLKSSKTAPWNGRVSDGRKNEAWINYNSSSKILTVAFTSFVNGTNGTQVQRSINYLDHIIDLNQHLPDRVIVGFSASTGTPVALHGINSWSFNSTSLLDESANDNINIGLAVGLGVGGCLILFAGLVLFWKKGGLRKSEEEPIVVDDEFDKGTGPTKFPYNELALATSDFKEEEKLGEGGFGGVYKGFIKDLNSYVAVKRISKGSKQGQKEYTSEVRIISRLRHRNLVQLIGWCHEKGELLLVYEFMPNGSLDSHLFKAKNMLVWEARYRIAQGLASGLLYLHEEWEQCVVHRDIKSSNILLDSNFNAKLGDFGLARLVDHGEQSQTTVLAGTMGYMAPECLTNGKASKESDVYSFGVVVLEIACGRKPIDPHLERNQINMVEWVWELYGKGKLLEATDQKLCEDFDEKQMECLMIVGLWCAHPDYNMRPSIQRAIQVLNFEAALPVLPPKKPVATYSTPPPSLPLLMSSCSTTGFEICEIESSGYAYSTNSS
ncbi:hypothetical protein L3X38_023285 [Prunus dulcis]|uniref:Protein kinase domain-containing protein n=1 Tax=Prunus dulcis TaxID=3755 RepID=A0AAD4VXJ8_PRUDU|nr:hypothetical protein L3X38_023285 [Prunus dulcis]